MLDDVDHVAVRRPDEEAGHAPLLGGHRMHKLVAALPRLGIRGFDVVDPDRDHRVLSGSGVADHQLEADPALREV